MAENTTMSEVSSQKKSSKLLDGILFTVFGLCIVLLSGLLWTSFMQYSSLDLGVILLVPYSILLTLFCILLVRVVIKQLALSIFYGSLFSLIILHRIVIIVGILSLGVISWFFISDLVFVFSAMYLVIKKMGWIEVKP